MQYQELYQDLFAVNSTYYLAHCIASDFRMGAGIAVEFQRRFQLRDKLKIINSHAAPGTCILVGRVFNLITKMRSSDKPTYETLTAALQEMQKLIVFYQIQQVAMPKIGCGLDHLQWDQVRMIIQSVFVQNDLEILICHKI